MDDKTLNAIRARVAAITEGPWFVEPDIRPTINAPAGGYMGSGHLVTMAKYAGNVADAEFIAAAPDDVRALLESVARLQKQAATRVTTTPVHRRSAVCPVCDRRITLTVTGGRFRRHMSAKGVVCDGAWKRPGGDQ